MQSLPVDPILQFLPNTLDSVRKQYNLHQPERIEEAVNMLYDWLNKQNHMVKKNFVREYLERLLINCKGSVERAKRKLDAMCTLRTLMPNYFGEIQIKEHPMFKDMLDAYLPNLTDSYRRVFLIKNSCKKFNFSLLDYYKWLLLKCEYFQSRDYCNGTLVIIDFTDINILEYIKVLNFAEIERFFSILTEGYAMRIHSIHIITPSNMIDTLVNIIKKAMNEKLGGRIYVHKNFDPIHNLVPKDILPIEYGGKEKSLQELHDKFMHEIASDIFQSHLEDMKTAQTIEALRLMDNNVEITGMSGSFRKLNVD